MRERLQRSSSGKRGESTFGTQCAVEEGEKNVSVSASMQGSLDRSPTKPTNVPVASTHGRSLEQDHANVGGGGGENASPSAFAHNSATPDHHHPTASTPAFNAPDTVPSTLTPQGANWEAQGFEEAIFRTITQPLPRFRVVDTVRVTAPFIISSQGVDVVSADSKGAPETPIVPNQDSEQVNVAKSLPDSFHSAKSVSASPTTTSDIPDVNMHAFGAISGIEAGLDPLSASGHASPPASHASAQATPRPQKIKSGPLSPESPKTPLNLRATVETAIQPAIPVTPAPCLPVHPATPRPSFHDGNSTQQSQKIAGAVRNVNTHPDKFLRHMFSAAQNWGGGGGSSGLKLHERRLSLSPPMERAASDCEGGSTILSAPSAPLTSTEIPSAALEAWNISACTVELEMPLSSGKGTFEPPMNASPICASQEKSFPVQASPPSTNKPVNPLKGHEAPNWSEMSSPSLTSLPPVKKSRLPKCAKDSLNLFPVSSTNSKGQNEKRSPRGLFEAVGTVRLGSGNSSLQRLNSHQGPAEDESLSRWDATTSLSVPGNGAKDTPKTPPSENIFAAEDSSEPSFMSVLKSDAIMPMQAHDIDSKASVQPSSVVLKGNNVEVNFGSVTSSPKIVSEMLKTLNLTSTETLDHDEGSEWRSATMQEHVPKPRLISSPPTPPTVERSENISPHSTNPDPHDNSMQETINIFSHMVHDIPNWGERGATHDDSARKNLPTKRAHKAHEHTKPLQHRHKDSHWQRQSRPGQAERRDPSISFADLSAAGTTEDRTASWASDQRHRQMNLHDSNEPSLMPIMDPENQDENASPVQPRRDIAVNAASVGPFSIQSSSTEQSLEYALDDARFITDVSFNESFVGPNFHAYSALSKELDSEFVISGNEVNVRYTKGLFVPTAGTVLNPALLAEEMSRQQQSKALPIIPPQISAHTDTQTIKKSVTDHVCVVAKTPSPPTYVSAAIGSPVTLRQSYAPQSPSMTAFPQKRTSQAIALSSPNMQTNVLSHQESPVSDLLPAPFFQPPFLLPPAQGPTNSCQNNPPAAPTVATKPPLVPSVTMSSANGLRAISSSDQDNSPLVPMGATSTTAPRTLSAALEAPPPKIKPLVPLRLPGQGSSNHQVFMFSGVPKFTEDGRVIALNDEDRKQRPVIEKPELSFLHGTGEYVPRAGRYIAPVESSYVDDENFYGRSGSSIHRSSIGHERPSTSSINQRSSHSSTSSTASYGNRTSMPAAPYGTRSANSILHRATTGTASSTSTYEHQGIPSESVSSAYFSTYSSSAYDTRSTTQPSGSGSLAQNGIGSCR
ncbi:hypothetical protein BC830DRAFT_1166441 [Chytriomyces sp. MP71]|nr:hypothetical protein BC830DRAFT_1166441 [Chytriomyces sp. MP71]